MTAALVLAVVAGGTGSAYAADGTPTVTVDSPAVDSTVALGDLPVKMSVELGGEASGRVDVSLGYDVKGSVEIASGTCGSGCQVTVPLQVGDWNHPGLGAMMLTAKLTTASGGQAFGGGNVYVTSPSSISDLRHVRDGQLFSDAVVDTTGTFRVSSQYPRDDVAELRVIDLATGAPVLTGSAPFDVPRGVDHDAVIDLGFAAVPDGLYRVEAKARDASGFYGSGKYTFVRVNHQDPVLFDTGTGTQVSPAYVGGNLKITGPLLSGSKPDVVKLTVDGVDRAVSVTPAWKTVNWQDPATSWQNVQFVMGDPQLTLGTHQISLSLLDTAGRLIGAPAAKTITVTDFSAAMSAPKLVVGRASTVAFSADPPAGKQLDSCEVGLAGPSSTSVAVGSWCSVPNPLPSLRKSATVTPRLAGANKFTFFLHTTDGYARNVAVPATVYAARRATVSAPAVPYGGTGTAKVVVQDMRSLNVWSAAPSGVTVYLQRQAVGTTRWVTLGSAKTVAGGVASIPFVSAINGAFRAVLASSVPGETLITRAIGAVSSSVVSWRIAPRTAVHGRAVAYEALANPYDAGAYAILQVRKVGATKWTSAKTVAVPTTRITRFGYAFPSAGTWYVRVYRPATKQHAAGLSIIVTVKVS
ncbi:hypothetical protein [Kribbella sindirgiensis]|uniref:Ig-like domain repeat protein n=1 Tax=Kribbella sindirgiensis TaxID=1124744 RepID=A0A4R0JFP6_9ACTN|nr:hypothetical protein [Kribbella sindirgiensis]TCC43358.1 hypothetical protein E0H50_02465 [Kribbella sindirgiensis]